jgi:acetoacetate decarboxylase
MMSHSDSGKIIGCDADNSYKIVLKKLHIPPIVCETDIPVKNTSFIEYKCGLSTEKYKTKAYKITYDSTGVCAPEYLYYIHATDVKKMSDMALQHNPTFSEQ